MPRLFVAAWPSRSVIEDLRGVPTPPTPGVRWVPERNWHITLRFVGEADADVLTNRLTVAALPRVTATLRPWVEIIGRHSLVVPVAGVDGLANAVLQATAGLGAREQHDFWGHLTLARLQPSALDGVGDGAAGSGRDEFDALSGYLAETSFEIREIAVVESHLEPTGVRYESLQRITTVRA